MNYRDYNGTTWYLVSREALFSIKNAIFWHFYKLWEQMMLLTIWKQDKRFPFNCMAKHNYDQHTNFHCRVQTHNVLSYLTQCARIRVPLVVMKIEKYKDLFRAALDRWLDSHESKNFGFGYTRRPINPIFSAFLPILCKI